MVGAKLGTEAINTSLLAGVIGFVLVLAFMIVVYRIPGLAASLALCLYVTVMIICLNLFNVTLTLYGVAGIILYCDNIADACHRRVIIAVCVGGRLRKTALPAVI